MAQVSVIAATARPAPTAAENQRAPGSTRSARMPRTTREPAARRTWRSMARAARAHPVRARARAHVGRAHRAGREALLVGQGGVIAEGSITSVGFVEVDTVVWPDAPVLQGIAMQVLGRALAAAGVESKRRSVFLSDVASFVGAFLTNSRGFAAVGRIDTVDLPLDAPLLATARRLHREAPWDEI
ncbi:aminotransferase class IV [Kitasatospora herbaricolor]